MKANKLYDKTKNPKQRKNYKSTSIEKIFLQYEQLAIGKLKGI